MNYEFYIAKRILKGEVIGEGTASKTRPIIRIAMLAVALGMMVMLIAIAIVTGFQQEIRGKVIGFGAHIQISNFDKNASFETQPVERIQGFLPKIKSMPGVRHVQVYATKAAIIKTDTEIEGVVLKGVGSDFDWNYFKSRMVAGNVFSVKDSSKTDAVIISKYTAQKLNLKVGASLLMYFIQQPPRVRKFTVSGIYETGLEELDKLYVLCDIGHIQKLNDWKPNQVAGFEVLINDFNQLDAIGKQVYQEIGYNMDARTIKELYPQVFDWLKLQDINVYIIIILMVLVAGINMISALLIIILERTTMIGLLKAMGARNWGIRKVFLYVASSLTLRGMLLGNIVGIALCLIQKYTGLVRLSQESYYVSVVPIYFRGPASLW